MQDGVTPLMVAAAPGHTASVQSLVAAGADMDIQDNVSSAAQPELHPHMHLQSCAGIYMTMNAVTTAGWSHCTYSGPARGKVRSSRGSDKGWGRVEPAREGSEI